MSDTYPTDVTPMQIKMRLSYEDWKEREDEHRKDMAISAMSEIARHKYKLVGELLFAYRYLNYGPNLTEEYVHPQDNETVPDTVEVTISGSCVPLTIRTVRR